MYTLLTLSIDVPCNGHLERDSCKQHEETSPLFTVNLIPCRPLLGEIVNLDLNVDIHTTVTIETDTDTETSDSKVVVGECTNNPESISLTVLHRSGQHISAEQGIPEFQPYSLPGREQSMVKKKKSSDSGVKLALPLTWVL